MRILQALLMSVVLATVPVHAQPDDETAVDVALVLAIDVSGSVNDHRWEVQRQGYAAAFEHSDVIAAAQSGMRGRIAISVIQWSGFNRQQQSIQWHIVSGATSAKSLSAKIRNMPRFDDNGMTYISEALSFSIELLEALPFNADRRVIDISGDGLDTDAFYPLARVKRVEVQRRRAISLGMTINGLPIIAGENSGVVEYYEEHVIGGVGAFSITVNDPDSHSVVSRAIRMKLVREIALR